MKHYVICSPNVDSNVRISFAQSLSRSVELSTYNDIRFHFDFIEFTGTPVTLQHNIVANKVLNQADIEGLILINNNFSWDPQALLKLVSGVEDSVNAAATILGAAYAEEFGVLLEEGFDPMREDLPAEKVSLDFTYIPKKVLSGLTQFVEKGVDSESPFYFFFEEKVVDGILWEEDYAFSRLVRNSGFKLTVDSSISCTNTATMPLKNSYRDFLARKWVEESTADMPQI
jgi:hypothetical protein